MGLKYVAGMLILLAICLTILNINPPHSPDLNKSNITNATSNNQTECPPGYVYIPATHLFEDEETGTTTTGGEI